MIKRHTKTFECIMAEPILEILVACSSLFLMLVLFFLSFGVFHDCTVVTLMPNPPLCLKHYPSGLATPSCDDKPKPQQQNIQNGQTEDMTAKESRSQKHNRVSAHIACVCIYFKGMIFFFLVIIINPQQLFSFCKHIHYFE